MVRRFFSFSAFFLVFLAISANSQAYTQLSVVQCYDRERAVVQARKEEHCKGEILSNEDAKRIKAKLHRDRIKRAKKLKSDRHQGPRGHGTGFFVTDDGMVVTNHHVIDACKRIIWIDTTDGQEGTATVVASDPANDLALLKTNLKAPATATFQTPVEIGSGGEISVIGYGTHKLPPLRPKLTPGTFGTPNRNNTRLQMQVAVRPGNSGGPVLDASGHVIGVVYVQINTPAVFKKHGELILDPRLRDLQPGRAALPRPEQCRLPPHRGKRSAPPGRRLQGSATFYRAGELPARR